MFYANDVPYSYYKPRIIKDLVTIVEKEQKK